MKITYPKLALFLVLAGLFTAILLLSPRLTDKPNTQLTSTAKAEITEAVFKEMTQTLTVNVVKTVSAVASPTQPAAESTAVLPDTCPITTDHFLPALSPSVSDTVALITGLPNTTRLPQTSSSETPPVFITGLPDTTPLELSLEQPVLDKNETVAAYIATAYRLDFPKSETVTAKTLTEELEALVRKASENHINVLYFQVRPASDAFYDSAIFPSSRYLVRNEGDTPPLDVLKTLLAIAKRYGIKIYAWINPYRITSQGEKLEALSDNNPARLYPEYIFEKDGAYYYQPALEEVRALIAAGIAEIVRNYDVDGILFDDYFYPENMKNEDESCYEAYRRNGGTLSLGDWRRENINMLIRECYQTIKSIRTDCAFGVAPRGIWRNIGEDADGSMTAGGSAYDGIYCDALAWVKEKTVDFLAPQLYWSYHEPNAPFLTLALWWENALKNSNIALIPSLAAYRLSEEELAAEIFYLSSLEGCNGYALYRITHLPSS